MKTNKKIKTIGKRIGILALVSAVLMMLFVSVGAAMIAPQEEWNRTYGGTSHDAAFSSQKTLDGGYVFAGETISFGVNSPNTSNAWLVKINSSGDEEWNRTYGGNNSDTVNSVQQASDGGYILAGHTNSFGSNNNFWLIKTDSLGIEEWNKTFGDGEAYSVQQTSDGGYIVTGAAPASLSDIFSDVRLIKVDSSGNEEWSKKFGWGVGSTEIGQYVEQTSDSGYIVAGATTTFGTGGSYDAWLIKTNATGVMQWNKKYVVNNIHDRAYSAKQTLDGGYVLTGNSFSWRADDSDIWIIRTNSSGNIQWSKVFAGSGYDMAYDIQITSDGGYIVAGMTNGEGPSGGIYANAWLIKTNSSGGEEWNKSFGGASGDKAYSVQQISDIEFAFAGQTASYGIISTNAWFVKISNEYYNGSAHIINGKVIDSETKAGIAGVKVSVNATLSDITGPDGSYSFIVSAGDFNLTAGLEPIYYVNDMVMISIYGKEVTTRDIELIKKPTGNITGSVMNG